MSISSTSALAWGWGGEGGCSFSKNKVNQEAKTEQVEETDT